MHSPQHGIPPLGQLGKRLCGFFRIRWRLELPPCEPESRANATQDSRQKTKHKTNSQSRAEQGYKRIPSQQPKSSKHQPILRQAQADIRKRLGRCIDHHARSGLGRMRGKSHSTRKQHRHDFKHRMRVAHGGHGQRSRSNRANEGVDGVPSGVDPRNLVGEKFDQIQHPRDRENHGMPKHLESLQRRRQRNPIKPQGQTSHENREVEIQACKGSQTQRDGEHFKDFHAPNIPPSADLSRAH